ncbi:MAG: NosD domain-containing protein, partial [Candidatus Odinarchaeota archaeon]
SNNTLSGNTMSYNTGQGIYLSSSSNNTLSGNTASNNNGYGIRLYSSFNNTLTGTTVVNNQNYGIYLQSSGYNDIYLNDFTGNRGGAVQGYSDTTTNSFSDGVAGNYWNDYTGSDSNGDGIGETPYSIDGGAGVLDPHPLVVPVGEFRYPHAPIYIDGNLAFAGNATLEGWSGHGTETHPYIIERYNITTDVAGTHGIEIRNTDVHFTIRNCYLSATGGTFVHGIKFSSVTNGKILNNIANGNTEYWAYGIYLHQLCDNNSISGNTVYGSDGGIYLADSSNNIIIGNNVTNNRYGIYIESSSSHNVVIENFAINNSNYGLQLSDDYSYNNTISNNTFIDNNYGIRLAYPLNSTVTANRVINNSARGISIEYSHNNTVFDNLITGNGIGMYFSSSSSNVITRNMITGNGGYGVYLTTSDNNTFYLNDFITNRGNLVQAYSTTATNNFSDGTAGNFWSDYTGSDSDGDGIGETSYSIDGGAGVLDSHPLMVPFRDFRYPHAPISINGYLDFATQAVTEKWRGSGTVGEPYIIEGLNITTSVASTRGIIIQNTDVHFIIRNCFIRATGGIYLYNVENSTLTGNTASNNAAHGIYLYSSSHNTLSGNTVNNNIGTGITIASSSHNTLSGNTVTNNSWWVSLKGGIHLLNSSNNTLSGNTVTNNNGIAILLADISNNNTLSGNTVTNSTNNGGIHLLNSSNNTLSGNTVNNNIGTGITIENSSNNTLTGNTASNNGNDGIYLVSSSNNTLTGNTASNNGKDGIYLVSSSNNNTLTGTIVTNNQNYGIFLQSSGYNDIYLNDFISNRGGAVQGYSGTNTNVFTNGSHGNFWSDYTGFDNDGDGIGEAPYSIDGGAGAEDPHPLMVSSIGVLTW